jgi:hypothetical protein
MTDSSPNQRLIRALGAGLPIAWFCVIAAVACVSLVPNRILHTQASDLANHVRHTWEFGLAVREGQFPPLIAPALNAGQRIPLFQYYTGTAYLVPGMLSAAGLDPYTAIRFAILLTMSAAGWFSYLACLRLRASWMAAIVASTAFELFPFFGVDLLNRGAFPEVIAGYTTSLLFLTMLCLVQARGKRDSRIWVYLTGLTWAYFIPIHPIQSLLCGALITMLVASYALFDLADRERASTVASKLVGALAIGAIGSAWFWWPIVRDYDALRIVPHGQFGDAGLDNLRLLLLPWHRDIWGIPGWAPQLGLHCFLASALAMLWFRRTRALGALAGLSVLVIVCLIRWHSSVSLLDQLFKPLQWTYRLLIPAAFATTISLVLVVEAIGDAWRHGRQWRILCMLIVGYTLTLAVFYFAHQSTGYEAFGSKRVIQTQFMAPNSEYYALRGVDFRKLEIVHDQMLVTSRDFTIPLEGYPFDIRLVLRELDPAAEVLVLVDGARDRGVTRTVSHDGHTLTLTVHLVPQVGHATSANHVLRFESAQACQVLDLAFHIDGDLQDSVVRIPDSLAILSSGTNTLLRVDVASGKEGLYQLPFTYLPSNGHWVNGVRVGAGSVDRFMTVVPLAAGENLVRIETRPTRPAQAGLLALFAVPLFWAAARAISTRRRQ